jgi:IclR family acetate operon transcriptional repressor
VLEGSFALLEAIRNAGEAGLSQLAAESDLPKSTVHRLLEQLVALGAVERSRGRYRMGPRVFRLGQGWDPYPRLREAARHPVRHLAASTGATVGLCTLWEGQTMLIAGIPGEAGPLVPLGGGRLWLWSTAAGKLITANGHPHAPPRESLPLSWSREAKTILDRGIAFDHEEIVQGVSCVAVPLRDREGGVVASLFAATLSSQRLPYVTDHVLHAARHIDARLRTPARRGISAPLG